MKMLLLGLAASALIISGCKDKKAPAPTPPPKAAQTPPPAATPPPPAAPAPAPAPKPTATAGTGAGTAAPAAQAGDGGINLLGKKLKLGILDDEETKKSLTAIGKSLSDQLRKLGEQLAKEFKSKLTPDIAKSLKRAIEKTDKEQKKPKGKKGGS